MAQILKATRQPINVVTLAELGMAKSDLAGSLSVQRMYVPEQTKKAQMIEGEPVEVAGKLLAILREKGFGKGG